MTTRDQWIKIADVTKNIKLPTQLDAAPQRLVIRTRTWSGQTVGEGTYTDSDLVLPQKFKVRNIIQDKVPGNEFVRSGGKYEMTDVVVSGITKRPTDDDTIGYTTEQLAPTVSAQNVEVIYILLGESPGTYSRLFLDSDRLLSHWLYLRQRAGNSNTDNMIRIFGDSKVTVD